MPREIHSNNQSIISSEFFDGLSGLAGITRAKSIVYRPQSNGRAERAVQSTINALRLYLVFRKLDWIYAQPLVLWGLDDLPGPIAAYSPHRLVFGRDPIRFAGVPPLTVDTGMEHATEHFRRAQDGGQLIKIKLVGLHAREYQYFLKKHPSLQFKEGACVWVQNRADQPGPHPKLDRICQGPAETLCRVSTNTYLVNLNGKEVVPSVGRLKPYITRRDGVNPPLHHYSERQDLHNDSYVVEDVLDHEYRGKILWKPRSCKQPFEGGKPWWTVKYRGFDRPEWHDVTASLHDIEKDWLN